jgi:hypothetical protein
LRERAARLGERIAGEGNDLGEMPGIAFKWVYGMSPREHRERGAVAVPAGGDVVAR